jgi:hypothetical protein
MATEELSLRVGQTLAGLLNATLVRFRFRACPLLLFLFVVVLIVVSFCYAYAGKRVSLSSGRCLD